MKSKTIKVIIADDHPIFRGGLVSLLEHEPDVEVAGEATNGIEALSLIADSGADVVILDVDMPEFDGIAVARQLKEGMSNVGVIFLTMHKDAAILRSMRSLNARGYVLKDSAPKDIVDCVRRVSAGRTFIGKGLEDLIFDAVTSNANSLPSQLTKLTQAELQILRLVGEYKTNKDIAHELFVTIKTVETHRYNICMKLGLTGPHALLAFANEHQKDLPGPA